MGFSYRKSVNLGGVRLNISKSGIGFSTGIKGLRVGVNSKGQTYVSGGTHGLYYRKNVNSFNQEGVQENNKYITKKEEGIITGGFFLIFTIFIIGIFANILALAGLSIILAFCLIIYLVADVQHKKNIEQKFKKKIIDFKENVKCLLDISDYESIVKLIEKMKDEEFDYDIIAYVLSDVYEKFIKDALADSEISNTEKSIMTILSEYIPETTLIEINNSAINDIVTEVLADNVVTEAERNMLTKIMSIIKITDFKRGSIIKMLEEYDKIQKIKTGKLIPVKAKSSLDKACYYIGNIDIITRRKGKYNYTYNISGSGKIEIYSDMISIIANGNKIIKLDDILDISLEDNYISVIIKNKKTPIYLDSEESAYVIALIAKLKSELCNL